MEYVKLGNTDIKVSKICLGCMSFGEVGTMHDWTLNEEATEKVVKHALDLGINFFDTANVYSKGSSEIFLGKALKKLAKREDVVIASKVYFNEGHLSKEAILREIDGTLNRLGTSYLDLYIIHRFDYDTPISEVMETLDSLVKCGKVRAIGASAMYTYQFVLMQEYAKEHNLTQFVAMENHYNLLYREDERDMIPYCKETDVLLMPYSPLASGHLARPTWNKDSLRSRTDKTMRAKYDSYLKDDMVIVSRVKEVADHRGVSMSEVALSWMMSKGVESPIIGATKLSYIDDAVNALKLKLTDEEIAYLEEEYAPHKIVGAI